MKYNGIAYSQKCPVCGENLEPIWFEEKEYITEKGIRKSTGRKRRACSHLECPQCGHQEAVDDSFDGRFEAL
jgi:transposase